MTPEDQVAELLASKARMTVKSLPIGYALMRGEQVVMHAAVRICPSDKYSMPLHMVRHLRESASMGVEARAVFASPLGVMVKKITTPAIDGWIGVGRNELVVTFGQIKVGDRWFPETVEPLQKVAESRKEWFV